MVQEADDKQPPGAVKHDQGKVQATRGFLQYFPRAICAVTQISEFGARKYDWDGFRHVEDGIQRYTEAGTRHVLKEAIEGEFDSESELLHRAHKAWNAMAELELFLTENPHLIEGAL